VNLADVQELFYGSDIYVIGSGKSLDYYEPAFFKDKLTIGVNFGWSLKLDRVDYMVTKYHAHARDWVESDRVGTMVVTRGERGHHDLEAISDDRMLVVDHNHNTVEKWNGEWPENGLVATHSSITMAMHLAAVLGASTIVMVGADCGVLDGEPNLGDYNKERRSNQFAMFESFDKQNQKVANIIREKYGASVISLSPFVTPNMEGHKFVSYAGALNAS